MQYGMQPLKLRKGLLTTVCRPTAYTWVSLCKQRVQRAHSMQAACTSDPPLCPVHNVTGLATIVDGDDQIFQVHLIIC
jgi:hypothetical protein